MLFTSGKSSNSHLTQKVFEFFTSNYEISSDVEVYHTNLSDDNAFGFTEVNGEEQFIQIHNKLSEKDYVITLLHELVHVVQNEVGVTDDEERENQAYKLEMVLYNQFANLSWIKLLTSRLSLWCEGHTSQPKLHFSKQCSHKLSISLTMFLSMIIKNSQTIWSQI